MKLASTNSVGWTLPVAMVLLIACAGLSQGREDDDAEEVVKSINDVPAHVRDAANELGGPDIRRILKVSEEGEARYEFEFTRDGRPASAVFTARGELCELERAVDASRLPEGLLASIQKRYPGATIQEAEKIETHAYEVRIKVGSRLLEVDASISGRLAEDAKDDDEGLEDEEENDNGKK